MALLKVGTTVFKTTPYGERLYNGPVRTYFRNEVRLTGSVYRVVEVTMRCRVGEEAVYEYVTPTEYLGLMQAIDAAIKNRKEYLQTAAAAELVNVSERLYVPGADEVGSDKAA